jgi:hypothetical protein
MKTLELTETEISLLSCLMEDLKGIPVNEHGCLFLFDTKRDCTITVIDKHVSCVDSIMEKIKQTKSND